jgi:hypothetical protein
MLDDKGMRMWGAAVVVGLFLWPHGAVNASAAVYDWCYNSCGPEAACTTECENDGGGGTTCGEYDGGASNGWCDGDTCDNVCGPWSHGSWSCYHQGQPTDCYEYGDYAQCGDDLCAFVWGVEDCSSCAADCGQCPVFVCGNSECEFGETFRTCPIDCNDPGTSGYCGDGICSSEETTSCADCLDPDEYCDGINHFCPVAHQCVSNWCSLDDVEARQTCNPNSSYGPHYDCPVDFRCQRMWNVMTNTGTDVCVRDRN